MGELMDGDNKVDCEVCAQKKATIRRTCIGQLPNTMILHLKRFDLDFQTFETVKLNNRMAFNTRLNMLKYTKEGAQLPPPLFPTSPPPPSPSYTPHLPPPLSPSLSLSQALKRRSVERPATRPVRFVRSTRGRPKGTTPHPQVTLTLSQP